MALRHGLQTPAIEETVLKTYMFSLEKTQGEHHNYFQIFELHIEKGFDLYYMTRGSMTNDWKIYGNIFLTSKITI